MVGHAETELLPGTEILLHLDEHGSYVTAQRELELIPQPSNDPSDPLNWSKTWKAIVIVNQAMFVFISVLTPFSIAPLTPIFIQLFNTTLPKVNMLFGAAAIALGYSNLVLVPLANLFGRRFVILLCGLICIGANIWQALVTSYPSFIGARVISGLGAAANESLMPMIIADMFFLHQRGLWMGVYFWSYFLGLFVGPIISGSVAAHLPSWRWFFWICTILQAINLIVMAFLAPETRFRRDNMNLDAHNAIDIPAADSDKEKLENNTSTKDVPSLTGTRTPPTAEFDKETNVNRSASNEVSPSLEEDRTNVIGTGRPTKAQFSLIPKLQYDGLSITLHDITAPFYIFTYPIILWVALSLCFSTNCLLVLNLTESQVFAAPPYLFAPAAVGYTNFAFFIGSIVGLVTAGPFSDWVSMRATRRNGGVREAEMRLISLVPYIAICLIGMVVSGVGYQRHWPWQAIVVIGYGFVGVEVVSIPAILIAYAVDCYKHIPGEIMVTATIAKNTFGFGMIFYINDWAVRSGFIPPVLTIMALTVGFTTFGMVIFMKWGKTFRRMTSNSKLHKLA